MRRIRLVLVLMFMLSYLNATSIAETNAQKISIIAANAVSKTGINVINDEVIKRATYKLVSGVSNEVIAKVLNQKLNYKINAYIRDLIKNGGFKKLFNKKFNTSFKTDAMWIGGDLFVELVKEAIMKFSTLEYRYNQSIVWWIDIGYTDFKAAINPNKVAGAIDFTIGNGKVLADMANKINQELKTLGKLKWDIRYGKARYRINKYEAEALEKYTSSSNSEEKNKILEAFKLNILSEKVFGDIFSSGRRDVFNIKIEGLKYRSIKHILDFDKNKFAPLLIMLKNNEYDKYQIYVQIYFPSDIASFLINNYSYCYKNKKISSVKRNTIIFDYSIRALGLGFKLEDFGVFYMGHITNKDIERNYTYTLISKAQQFLYGDGYGTFKYSKTKISRKNFAKTLVSKLYLKLYLSKADINSINTLKNEKGLNFDMLVLNKLGIVIGIAGKTVFRGEDNLTRLELLIMIVRVVEYCQNNKWRIL